MGLVRLRLGDEPTGVAIVTQGDAGGAGGG
jgi:hypothetical protein